MNNRIRYTVDEVAKNTFYQMPKFLLAGEFKKLNNDARVLYSVCRDRHDLSLKNGWKNEDDEVYIIFSREEMCETLGLSENTILKAMNALKKYDLIQEERQGLGRPNKIFLLTVKSAILPQNRNICGSTNAGFEGVKPQDLRFLPIYNNTNLSDTESESTSDAPEKVIHNQGNDNDVDNDYELSSPKKDKEKEPNVSTADQSKETKSSTKNLITRFDEHDYNTYRKKLQENIEYSHFLQYSRQDISLIDELVDCMLDVIFTEGDTVKINGEMKNRQMVINQYLKINPADIELILAKYKEQQHKITHIHNYLKTILYNIKQEQGHYYTNAVTGYMEKMAMQAANEVNETENL